MKLNETIQLLIEEGKALTFYNNSYKGHGETYGKLSAVFYSWFARIEDLILTHFGEGSAPMKMLSKANIARVNGNFQSEFDRSHNIIMGAITACLSIEPKISTNFAATNQDFLSAVFNKFHNVAIQLRSRYNNRATIDIKDEYDVQDVLHVLLKLYFNDIRKEEWTPSYAGGSSRMDFLLKEQQTVIEVKKTRVGLDDKELGKQLIIDKAKYKAHPDCKKLICFTYDPDGRILNPKGIENDLNSDDKDFIVDIVIKPNA